MDFFERNALKEYDVIKNGGKKYGFSLWLIADDVPLMESLRGEFNCYCEFLESKTSLDFVDIERMLTRKDEVKEKC